MKNQPRPRDSYGSKNIKESLIQGDMADEPNNHQHHTDVLAETRHHAGPDRVHPRSGFIARIADMLRPLYDGPPSWLWYSGIARLMVLVVVAIGAQQLVAHVITIAVLTAIYLAALGCSMWYLFTLQKERSVTPTLTWTQLFMDFSVVAVTVSFTGGSSSFFIFLFVMVILEAGALMGLIQGFVFAILSAVFVLFLHLTEPTDTSPFLPYWYIFLIQGLALLSAAVISGYWNQRVSRLKQFQREILDNMSSGFLICDTHGYIISANKASCIILDRAIPDIIGHSVADILVYESGAECPVMTALRNKRDYVSYEFPVCLKDGSTKLLGLTTNGLYDNKNNIIALIVIFSDLTEMAQMRQALQCQDRLAAIGESAAELAHEVRNPLTSLRSAVDELRRHVNESGLEHRLCSIALRESEHLNNIVTSFLEFARHPEFNREPIDLVMLLDSVKSAVEKRAEELIFRVRHNGEPCMISGDPTQIRQLFDNIIRNSVEAMDACGELVVTLRSVANHVELRFDDTGPGIAPNNMTRIFEPFFTEKEHGTGMGLAICQRIVVAHDGDIQVAASPRGGASMIVRLPLLRQQSTATKDIS